MTVKQANYEIRYLAMRRPHFLSESDLAKLQSRPPRKPARIVQVIPTEDEEQEALIARARLHEYRYPDLKKLCHIKNEGTTWSHRERGRARALGVLPGMPDLFLPVARHGYHGWFGEMKSLTGESSDTQELVIRELQKDGYFADVFFGQDTAWECLIWYLAPPRR